MEVEPVLTRSRLITLGVVIAVLGGLALAAPEIYTGTFSDIGTFVRVIAVVVALALVAVAARRWIPNRNAATAVAMVPAVIALAVFVWPYLRPATEVDEAFPPVAAAVQSATTTPPTSATTSETPATVAPTTTPATLPAIATTVTPDDAATTATSALEEPAPDEPAPTAPAPTASSTTVPPATTPPTTAPPATTPPTTVPPQTEPVELARSGFQGLTGHRGSGDAALYRLVDQSILLRFEEVDIGSGPALEVYVVPGADRRNLDDAVYVAPLTAERGNQNYMPPAEVDLATGTWTVLVWCETFDVEVANATLNG